MTAGANYARSGSNAIKLSNGATTSTSHKYAYTMVNQSYSDAARYPVGYSDSNTADKWAFSA